MIVHAMCTHHHSKINISPLHYKERRQAVDNSRSSKRHCPEREFAGLERILITVEISTCTEFFTGVLRWVGPTERCAHNKEHGGHNTRFVRYIGPKGISFHENCIRPGASQPRRLEDQQIPRRFRPRQVLEGENSLWHVQWRTSKNEILPYWRH